MPAETPSASSTVMNRGSSGGTLTRAKCSFSVFGLRTITARLSESPEMYGNGWAGSTASGVSTGKICSRNISCSRCCSSRAQLVPADHRDALAGEQRPHALVEHPRVPGHQLVGEQADLVEHLARLEPGRRPHRDPGGDPALEPGHAHHEELVEVAGEDREEPRTLEQRLGVVLGELEHPLVELQPARLAVEEAAGGLGGVRFAGRFGRQAHDCDGGTAPAGAGERAGELHVDVPAGETESGVGAHGRGVVGVDVEHRLAEPQRAQVAQARRP